MKDQGLNSYINDRGEFYNCVDVALFFEKLEAKLADVGRELLGETRLANDMHSKLKVAVEALELYAEIPSWDRGIAEKALAKIKGEREEG